MQSTGGRLGRGLGSLISAGANLDDAKNNLSDSAVEAKVTERKHSLASPKSIGEFNHDFDQLLEISVDEVIPNPYQPRKFIDPEAIKELSASIEAEGLLQPIVVRRNGENFELIAGERRWRAAQLAKLHEVPVIVRDFDDQTALGVAMIENLQRTSQL